MAYSSNGQDVRFSFLKYEFDSRTDDIYIQIAQLAEHWSPKPVVEGSIPSLYASKRYILYVIDG